MIAHSAVALEPRFKFSRARQLVSNDGAGLSFNQTEMFRLIQEDYAVVPTRS